MSIGVFSFWELELGICQRSISGYLSVEVTLSLKLMTRVASTWFIAEGYAGNRHGGVVGVYGSGT